MFRDRYSGAEAALRNILRERRVAAKLRQSDLAARLAVPQSFVSKYESGERLLTFVEVLVILQELGMNAKDLLARLPTPLK